MLIAIGLVIVSGHFQWTELGNTFFFLKIEYIVSHNYQNLEATKMSFRR